MKKSELSPEDQVLLDKLVKDPWPTTLATGILDPVYTEMKKRGMEDDAKILLAQTMKQIRAMNLLEPTAVPK